MCYTFYVVIYSARKSEEVIWVDLQAQEGKEITKSER